MYHYGANNPVKYTDTDGRWIDNGDGTHTAEKGDTLWGLFGADWQDKSGYAGDPTKLQIGDTVGNEQIQMNKQPVENFVECNIPQISETIQGASQKAKVYGLNPRAAVVVGIGLEFFYVETMNNDKYLVLGPQIGTGVEIGANAKDAISLSNIFIRTLTPDVKTAILSNSSNNIGYSYFDPNAKNTCHAYASVGIGFGYDLNSNRFTGLEIGNVGGGVYWGRRFVLKLK